MVKIVFVKRHLSLWDVSGHAKQVKCTRQTSRSIRPNLTNVSRCRRMREASYLPIKGYGVIIDQQRLVGVTVLGSET